MAHADYNCCAVCDSKLAYSSDSATKEEVCAACAVDVSIAAGVRITDSRSLIAWMASVPPSEWRPILVAVGFKLCPYENAVDDVWRATP